MISRNGRAAASEKAYGPADAEIGWRIANPIMCSLIGLIASGWNGALVGLLLGLVLVAAPYAWPTLRTLTRAGAGWARSRFVSWLQQLERAAPSLASLVGRRP